MLYLSLPPTREKEHQLNGWMHAEVSEPPTFFTEIPYGDKDPCAANRKLMRSECSDGRDVSVLQDKGGKHYGLDIKRHCDDVARDIAPVNTDAH